MEARAQARYIRVTPMKARRVVDLIRGMDATEAQAVLRFAPQAASVPVGKVLDSAIANAAHNYDHTDAWSVGGFTELADNTAFSFTEGKFNGGLSSVISTSNTTIAFTNTGGTGPRRRHGGRLGQSVSGGGEEQ